MKSQAIPGYWGGARAWAAPLQSLRLWLRDQRRAMWRRPMSYRFWDMTYRYCVTYGANLSTVSLPTRSKGQLPLLHLAHSSDTAYFINQCHNLIQNPMIEQIHKILEN